MKKIKILLKKFIYKQKATEKSYTNYLRKQGMKIGENFRPCDLRKMVIDEQYPWLITIGNNVTFTNGVRVLTHDFSWIVEKKISGQICGIAKKIVIGNNVFVGMNSTILGGTTIGDNVVIGANSLVTGNIPSNTVCAGNPAKVISKIEDYCEKLKKNQSNEALELARAYYERTNRVPPKEIFHEFFFLFEDRDCQLCECFENKLKLAGNYEKSKDVFMKSKPMFKNYDDFLNIALKDLRG